MQKIIATPPPEVMERLGTAVQSFIFKCDPKTGEVYFLLSRRDPKGSAGYKDAYAPVGGMANKGEQAWQTQLREAREEFGIIADDKKRTISQKFKAASQIFKAAAWRFFHSRRLHEIDAILQETFTSQKNGIAIHSQIHKPPEDSGWDATEDTFKAIELSPEKFDSLARLTVGYSTGNKEVSRYEVVSASNLFKDLSDPIALAMSMGIEKNAITKLLEHVTSLRHVLSNPTGSQACLEAGKHTSRPIYQITDAHIEVGSKCISHGARLFTRLVEEKLVFGLIDEMNRKINKTVKAGSVLACPVYFNSLGEKVIDRCDTYVVGAEALKDYEQIGTTDINIKKPDQTPIILLPHTVNKPSLIQVPNKDDFLPIEPGQRLIVRNGQVEVRTPQQVAHQLTLIELPYSFRQPKPMVAAALKPPVVAGPMPT